jgi:mRNA interferase MazF
MSNVADDERDSSRPDRSVAGGSYPRRGELYYVELDPVIGSEQGGRRPALVIQNDIGNQHSPVVIVAAVTSRPAVRDRPTDVSIQPGSSGLEVSSRVMLNQIRTVDKRRLRRRVGELTAGEMAQVDQAIRISLGLVSL